MRMKKLLAMLLTLSMVASMVSMGAFAVEETDTATKPAITLPADAEASWAKDSFERWAGYGIIKGDEAGNFNPDADITRGELAQILVNMFGLTVKAENAYADIKGDEWYADAVLKCTAAGIMKGDGTNAKAETPISRQETMVMLGRAVGVTPAAEPDMSKFPDSADVASWAAGYMAPLAAMGIISGVDGGKLSPVQDINRASIMSLLNTAVSNYVTAPGEVKVDNANGFVVVNVAAKEGEVILSGKTAGVVVAAGTAEGKIVAKNLTAETIKVDGTAAVSIEGGSKVSAVTANATGSVTVAKGVTVDTLTVNAAAKVTNNGTVKTANFNTADSTWAGKNPAKVNSPEGIKPPVTEGSSKPSGGGSDVPSVSVKSVAVVDGKDGVTPVLYPVNAQVLAANITLSDGTQIGTYPVNANAKYTWYVGDDTILGTESKVTITSDLIGRPIHLVVTVNGYSGSATWTANGTVVETAVTVTSVAVVAADGATAVTAPKAGDVLTANITLSNDVVIGSYPVNAGVSYRWHYEGSDNVLGTQPTYTVTADNSGKKIALAVSVQRSTGTWTAATAVPNYVATVNGVPYDAITKAIAAAPVGGTVKLINNITTDKTIVINRGVTIDGAGHTITGQGLTGSDWGRMSTILVGDGVEVLSDVVTISNLTVNGPASQSAGWVPGTYGIKVYEANNVTLTDVTVGGTNAGIQVNSSNVTMTGTIDVSGNNWGGINVIKGAVDEVNTVTAVPKLTLASGVTLVNTSESETNPTIWIDKDNGLATEQPNVTEIVLDNMTNKLIHIAKTAPAQEFYFINAVDEDSLVAALAAGGTVKLGKDINATGVLTVAKVVTLDLGGKKITWTGSNADVSAIRIEGTGSHLTVSNGTIEAMNLSKNFNLLRVNNDAKLTVNGGTYITNNGGKVIQNAGTTTITDGTITAANAVDSINESTGVYMFAGSTTTISGGTVTGLHALTVNEEDTTLTVEGDTRIISAGNGIDGGVANVPNYDGFIININGGTITANTGMYLPGCGTTNITGGTITGEMVAIAIRDGALNISGGSIYGTKVRVEGDSIVGDSAALTGAIVVAQPEENYNGAIAIAITGTPTIENTAGGDVIVLDVGSKVGVHAWTVTGAPEGSIVVKEGTTWTPVEGTKYPVVV